MVNLVNVILLVAVGEDNIEPAIVIVVEELTAERDIGNAGAADPHLEASVAELSLSVIMIERARFALEGRDQQIEFAVVIVVAPIQAHAAVRVAFAVIGGAGRFAEIGVTDLRAVRIRS